MWARARDSRACRSPSSIPSGASRSSRPPARRRVSSSAPPSCWCSATSRWCTAARRAIGRSSCSIRCVARALSSLADFVAYAGHLCAPDGRLLAMKGKRPDEEISALPKSFRVLAVHRVKLPGLDDERHLVELSPAGPRSRRGRSRAPHEAGHRSRKPEGRGRQDHHRGESRGLAHRHQAARAAHRSRSAGQCHHGLRHRQECAGAHQLRCAAGRLRGRGGAGARGVRRLHAHAGESGPHRGGGAAARA